MENIKSEYKRGMLYFSGLMICICLLFTTPDGINIYMRLLGLFRLNRGIPIGSNATLHIYGLPILIAIIFCIKKIFLHWRSYGSKFRELNICLRLLPIFVALPVILLSNMFQPSLIDRIYFSMLSKQSGLQAVSFYSTDGNLRFWSSGNHTTITYNLALGNHSDEHLEFQLIFLYQDMEGTQEVCYTDENSNAKLIALAPRQFAHFAGDFTVYTPMSYGGFSGQSVFSVVLVSNDEQHTPTRLVRRPLGF